MSDASPHQGPAPSRWRRRGWGRRQLAQERAIVEAEARLLAHVLRPYGILNASALEEASRASRWRRGGFDDALAAAARMGLMELLPLGFCRAAGPQGSPARRARPRRR